MLHNSSGNGSYFFKRFFQRVCVLRHDMFLYDCMFSWQQEPSACISLGWVWEHLRVALFCRERVFKKNTHNKNLEEKKVAFFAVNKNDSSLKTTYAICRCIHLLWCLFLFTAQYSKCAFHMNLKCSAATVFSAANKHRTFELLIAEVIVVHFLRKSSMGYLLSLSTLGTYLLPPPHVPLLPLSFPSLAPFDYEIQEMLETSWSGRE